jgi:hypothetical protein
MLKATPRINETHEKLSDRCSRGDLCKQTDFGRGSCPFDDANMSLHDETRKTQNAPRHVTLLTSWSG